MLKWLWRTSWKINKIENQQLEKKKKKRAVQNGLDWRDLWSSFGPSSWSLNQAMVWGQVVHWFQERYDFFWPS